MTRRALDALEPRHRPSRGEGTAAAPKPVAVLASVVGTVARVAQLGSLSEKVGFDVAELARRGVELVQDPAGALGAMLGDGMDALSEAIGGVLDSVVDWVQEWSDLLGSAWSLLKEVPYLGKFLATAEQVLGNFLDTVWYELTGQRTDPWSPPDRNFDCPGYLPSAEGIIRWDVWETVGTNVEIAVEVQTLIERFAPRVYEYLDDVPPIAWSSILDHAEDDPYGSGGSWDLDEDWARDPTRQIPAPPYVRAWKLSDSRLLIQLSFLRAASFWPCSRANEEPVFEHEGDGESLYVVVQVDKRDATHGDARLIGLVLPKHGSKYPLSWTKLQLDDGRVRVGVARGSHAISVVEGPATVGTEWMYQIQTDTYPSVGSDGVDGYVAHTIETTPGTLEELYESAEKYPNFERVHWGEGGLLDADGLMAGYKAWTLQIDGEAVSVAGKVTPIVAADARAACRRGGCPRCQALADAAEQEPCAATFERTAVDRLSAFRPTAVANALLWA